MDSKMAKGSWLTHFFNRFLAARFFVVIDIIIPPLLDAYSFLKTSAKTNAVSHFLKDSMQQGSKIVGSTPIQFYDMPCGQ